MRLSLDSWRELYAKIPDAHCKGLCAANCSIIMLQQAEYERIEMKRSIPKTPSLSASVACPLLEAGRCTVYDARPVICRLYGATAKLACPHGCEPDAWLAEDEANAIIDAAKRLSPRTRSLNSIFDRLSG